jgi:Flp pilus assembly protein TadD
LVSAVGRNPSDGNAWRQLGIVDFALGDAEEARLAIQRVAQLDPIGATTVQNTGNSPASTTPPQDSATAQPLSTR